MYNCSFWIIDLFFYLFSILFYMMKLFSIFLLSTSISLVHAILPTPRYNGGKNWFCFIQALTHTHPSNKWAGCAVINQRIYCYGGTANRLPTSDHYSLDLTKDFSVANSIESWNTVVPVGDFTVEPNSLFSIVPLNDSYLIHGGLGYGSSTQHLKNTTVIYHTSNNSWSALQTQNQTLMMPR